MLDLIFLLALLGFTLLSWLLLLLCEQLMGGRP
jgi:hypothetical protein